MILMTRIWLRASRREEICSNIICQIENPPLSPDMSTKYPAKPYIQFTVWTVDCLVLVAFLSLNGPTRISYNWGQLRSQHLVPLLLIILFIICELKKYVFRCRKESVAQLRDLRMWRNSAIWLCYWTNFGWGRRRMSVKYSINVDGDLASRLE